jgi:hypothetical protein
MYSVIVARQPFGNPLKANRVLETGPVAKLPDDIAAG